MEVADVRYVASQPWPFPGSLMLGFQARYAGGERAARDGELEDVALVHARGGRRRGRREPRARLLLPPPLAIARRLVDAWIGS